ncbi:hypothetical protein BDB01DRAFT_838660 [Pilobolus umbonatus]|nr:hypothetical protein BDB01DRAFT_838660 [Pilobolus umbonatus]
MHHVFIVNSTVKQKESGGFEEEVVEFKDNEGYLIMVVSIRQYPPHFTSHVFRVHLIVNTGYIYADDTRLLATLHPKYKHYGYLIWYSLLLILIIPCTLYSSSTVTITF